MNLTPSSSPHPSPRPKHQELAADHGAAALAGLNAAAADADDEDDGGADAGAGAGDDDDDDEDWHRPTTQSASPPRARSPPPPPPPPGPSVPLASPVRQAATAVSHAAAQMEQQAADAARAVAGGDAAAAPPPPPPSPPQEPQPQQEAEPAAAAPSVPATATTTTARTATTTAAAPAAPAAARPAGLGLGLGSMLPPRRAASAAAAPAAPAAAAAAAGEEEATAAPPPPKPAAAPPAKPAGLGGLGLGPREPAAAAAATAASASGGPSLPPRPSQQAQTPPAPAPLAPPPQQREPSDAAARDGGAGEAEARGQAAPAPPPPPPPPPPPAPAAPPPRRPALPALPARGAAALGARLAARPGAAASSAAASALAPPAPAPPSFDVVDPDEPPDAQRARRRLFDLRVALFRAALRLGVPPSAESVSNYASVVDRLERVSRPLPAGKRRADVARLAQQRAAELERSEPRGSPAGVPRVTLLLIGMTGTGKTELANALLDRPAARAGPFPGGGTRRLRVLKGRTCGIDLTLIDTPGLEASSDARKANAATLRAAAGALRRRKPDFVVYVDRLDAPKAGFGDLSVLQQIGAALGKGVWRQTMVALTHANAARAAFGGGGSGGASGAAVAAAGDAAYAEALRQRKNVLQNMLRQVSGEAQLRNPIHVVDSHPQTPRLVPAAGRLDEADEEEDEEEEEEEEEDNGVDGGARRRRRQQQQRQQPDEQQQQRGGERGEPVVFDAPAAPPTPTSGPMAGMAPPASGRLTPVPWRRQLLMQLAGLAVYEAAKQACEPPAKERKAAAKAAAAAQAQQQAVAAAVGGGAGAGGPGAGAPPAQQRARLPPSKYFLAQLVERAAAPRKRGTPRDPFAAGRRRDPPSADFRSALALAVEAAADAGDERALRRREADVKRGKRTARAFKNAGKNERKRQRAKKKYRGLTTSGLNLGPTFDPSQRSQHRYRYPPKPRGALAVMPTLDYYGWEHEDAITGVVADWKGQPGCRRGYGGVPARLTATLEKDKTTACLQAEGAVSLVHSLPPFGPAHVTQLSGAAELLRPSIKEVLYSGEATTFRGDLLKRGDKAGFGVMAARMAEAGDPRKGPMAVGVKVTETVRVGPWALDAVVAQVKSAGGGGAAGGGAGGAAAAMLGGGGQQQQAAADEVFGARLFIASDWIPGVALDLDWYRERTRAGDPDLVGGAAAALAYRFALPRRAHGKVTVDLVGGGDVAHVDLKLKSARDWRFAWALLLPAASWLKNAWRGLRERADREAEEEEDEEDEAAARAAEGEEGDEDEDDDGDDEGGGGGMGSAGGDGGMAALQALLGGAGARGARASTRPCSSG